MEIINNITGLCNKFLKSNHFNRINYFNINIYGFVKLYTFLYSPLKVIVTSLKSLLEQIYSFINADFADFFKIRHYFCKFELFVNILT